MFIKAVTTFNVLILTKPQHYPEYCGKMPILIKKKVKPLKDFTFLLNSSSDYLTTGAAAGATGAGGAGGFGFG